MQEVNQALLEAETLYQRILGAPAPKLDEARLAPLPPGVDPLPYAVRELDDLRILAERMALGVGPVAWVPPADSFAAPDAVVIRLEIPGVAREDVKVLVSGGECVVSGHRKVPEDEPSGLRPLAVERPHGPFERRFPLPPGAHPDKVSARYHEGLLEVRVPIESTSRETKVEAV